MPEISVIIPNYNHAPFLKERIDSVLNQTYKDFELIILDDCSFDKSKEIIDAYRVHPLITSIVYNEINSGNTFKQWHKGISLAKGKYVWIAESDDSASADFLEVVMQKVSAKQNVGICFSDSNWVDNNGNTGKNLSIYTDDFSRTGIEEIKNYLVKYNTIQNASAVIMRRDLAAKYIKNALRYKSCGDWCLYIDILQESNLVFIGKKLNNFRWYHSNISNAAAKKGLWISESLKIITYSNIYKIKFSRHELIQILRYWYLKPDQFDCLKKIKLKLLSIFYLSIFTVRVIGYQLLYGK